MTETRSGNTKAVWRLVLFFIFYLLFRLIVEVMMQLTALSLGPALPDAVRDFLLIGDSEGGYQMTGDCSVLVSGIAFLISGLMIRGKAFEYDKKFSPVTEDKRKLTLDFVGPTVLASIGLSIALNVLILKSGMAQLSAEYQETAAIQYSCSFPVGFLVYGFLSPFSEELMFRGILYNGLKRLFPLKSAVILTAALFALYHGNGIQGLFAFLLSIFIIYSYETTGCLWVALGVHSVCNLSSFIMTYVSGGFSGNTMWIICLISLGVSALSIYWLYFHKTDERKETK